jgi:hypothetical protein
LSGRDGHLSRPVLPATHPVISAVVQIAFPTTAGSFAPFNVFAVALNIKVPLSGLSLTQAWHKSSVYLDIVLGYESFGADVVNNDIGRDAFIIFNKVLRQPSISLLT